MQFRIKFDPITGWRLPSPSEKSWIRHFTFYRPQTKFAKVIFSQVSVCPQGGHACYACPPWHAHPLGPEHAPPGTYAPLADTTRCGQWAGGTHPTGMHSCLIPLVSLFFVFRFTAHREIKRLFFVLKRLKRDYWFKTFVNRNIWYLEHYRKKTSKEASLPKIWIIFCIGNVTGGTFFGTVGTFEI